MPEPTPIEPLLTIEDLARIRVDRAGSSRSPRPRVMFLTVLGRLS